MPMRACHLKALDGFFLPSRESPSLCSLAHRSLTTCCSHISHPSPQAPRVLAFAKGSGFPEGKFPLFTCFLGNLPCSRLRRRLSEVSHEPPGRAGISLQTLTAALVTLNGQQRFCCPLCSTEDEGRALSSTGLTHSRSSGKAGQWY